MKNHPPKRTPAARETSNSSMRTLALASKIALVLAGAGLPLQDAWANPGGEAVVAGSVDIQRRQDLMQIQASDGAIIDWQVDKDV